MTVEQPPATEHRDTAASLITAELMAALRETPQTIAAGIPGSSVPFWMRSLREWPSKVAPSNPRQIRAAVLTLISRALWPHTELETLIRILSPLYRAGWSNAAILYMLDTNPDGTAVIWPWRTTEKADDSTPRPDLHVYLDRRLRVWRKADPDTPALSSLAPNPPLPATTFAAWFARMHTVYGDGLRDGNHHASSTPPEQAQHAYDRNHRNRALPVTRARELQERQEQALSRLATASAPRLSSTSAGEFVPDDLALLTDPAVHAALVALVSSPRIRRYKIEALRRAVLEARANVSRTSPPPAVDYATADKLAATIVRFDGTTLTLLEIQTLLSKIR